MTASDITKLATVTRDYSAIVDEAAATGRAHIQSLARQGIHGGARLYYKTGALAIQSEAITHDMAADGWIATDRIMSAAIPYDGYWRWIYNHSRDLPLFA